MRITSIILAKFTYLLCSQYVIIRVYDCILVYIRVQAPKFLNLFDTLITIFQISLCLKLEK